MTEVLNKNIEKEYFNINFKENAKYNLFSFSARNTKIGSFSYYKSDYEDSLNRFMFNCENNDWYLNGIKGFSEDFENTIIGLKNIISESHIKKSLFIGSSMGAYGAISLGTLCQAQRVIGFGAEIITNLPGGYSKDNLFHLDKNSNLYDLKNYINSSCTYIDLFVGEGSPVDVFCAFYLQSCFNIRIHLIKNSDHAVVNKLKDKNLLRGIVNLGVTGLKLTLPEEIYTSNKIYHYLSNQNYEPDIAEFKKFALEYIDFYLENKENISLENYIHFYGFLFKAKFFNEALSFLEKCRIRFGKLQDFDLKTIQILYKQKKYQQIIDTKHLDSIPDFYYTKALSYMRLQDNQNFLKTIEDGVAIAKMHSNQHLFKTISSLKSYLKDSEEKRQQQSNILFLTTFPEHKSQNVGDNLICHSAIQIVNKYCPDFHCKTSFRETVLDDYADGEIHAIVAPGFSVANNVYPDLFKLYKDLKRLPRFYPIGCSFQHIIPSYASFEEYEYNTTTLDFLKFITEHSGALHCRDKLIVQLLERYNIPALYSGDMVLFDENYLHQTFVPPKTIKSIVFTIQHHPKYLEQSLILLDFIKKTFPDIKYYVAFHSKPGKMPLEVAHYAQNLGFELLHLYGDFKNLEIYNNIDLHIGYRLHGHITFLRKRKPSILMIEDARAFGFAHTQGTHHGTIEALCLKTMSADMTAPEKAMDFLKTQIKNDFLDYHNVFSFIDETYNDVVKPFFLRFIKNIQ